MNPEVNRRKTAMLLHELEMALGNFVTSRELSVDNVSPDLIHEIANRELERSRTLNVNSIRDVVEATYLDELFQIALDITSDTRRYDYLAKLKELFVLYDIYEVRNIISHPNRKFIDTYWYRLAALTSDPIIDLIGMDEIKKCLIAAENGEITDPPDEWYEEFVWNIPNNIPDKFEHAITGLVGRKKETDSLLKSLKNPRINTIALVAPGGIGKTALALDIINEQMTLPETKSWCDACIFISLKTEKLTAAGIKKLSAVETIDEIKEQLALEAGYVFDKELLSFKDLVNACHDQKILLFIDNLETLLVDSPDDFERFNESLPPSWRVLVTSRIAISYASIITINPLQEKSASHMARVYFNRRGGKVAENQVFETIAKNCYCNPLAIRLTVDLFLSGKEVPSSIEVANKEIAGFSYNNLIDSLSNNAIKILEALFVDDSSSRLDLCEILSLPKEDLAVGLAELCNTSLVSRKVNDDIEVFSLSSSVRDLLLTNSKNIAIRNEIQESINRRKVLALQIDNNQQSKNIPWYHWDYISSEAHEGLKILLTEFIGSRAKGFAFKSDRLIPLYKRFKESEHIYENNAAFQCAFGRVLAALRSKSDAVARYRKSIALDGKNPNARFFLAMLYRQHSDYEEAEKIYEGLIAEGWGEAVDGETSFAYQVNHGYFLTLLYALKHDVILDKTKKWKEDVFFRGMKGAFRASAWKRKSENIVNKDSAETIRCLTSSIRILDDVFKNDGYIKSACIQARNIFNEVAYCLVRPEYRANVEFAIEALTFIDEHLDNTVGYVKYGSADEVSNLVTKLAGIDVQKNPFRSRKTFNRRDAFVNGLSEDEIESQGLVKAKVKNIPRGDKSGANTFLFAVDEKKEDYFVHYDKLVNGGWNEWACLREGDVVAIKPEKIRKDSNKSRSVEKIYVVAS
tara:strand:+ start:1197 stop:3944 length:2748 start_codon:yes stop_codon:yes gene_type:complete